MGFRNILSHLCSTFSVAVKLLEGIKSSCLEETIATNKCSPEVKIDLPLFQRPLLSLACVTDPC